MPIETTPIEVVPGDVVAGSYRRRSYRGNSTRIAIEVEAVIRADTRHGPQVYLVGTNVDESSRRAGERINIVPGGFDPRRTKVEKGAAGESDFVPAEWYVTPNGDDFGFLTHLTDDEDRTWCEGQGGQSVTALTIDHAYVVVTK